MSEKKSHIMTIEAQPDPIRVDLLQTAILVVDMQNAFVRKGGYFDLVGHDISATQRIVEPCQKIINAAREKGIKTIYLQMGYSPDLSDKGPPESPYAYKAKVPILLRERPELKDKLYIYGTWGAEIIEELKPHQEDIVIKKQRYDGFVGTNLDIILRTLGIKYLIFVGIATNVCVESTLRRSFFLDYFPILISDAVSQKGPRMMQEATILNVQSTFGWVTDSIRLIKAIE
ncbi:MAG: isochorismatase family protein [Deltaproteobacteria bacterium]|nr:isochorismatase family protein [Deltaproteobacteria bacterium]